MRKIKVDLELDEGEGYVMVSDRQKGLIAAVKRELSIGCVSDTSMAT